MLVLELFKQLGLLVEKLLILQAIQQLLVDFNFAQKPGLSQNQQQQVFLLILDHSRMYLGIYICMSIIPVTFEQVQKDIVLWVVRIAVEEI